MDSRIYFGIGAALLGPLLGALAGRLVRKLIGRRSEVEAITALAPLISTFVFWALTAIGLLVALGMAEPDFLSRVPAQLIEYFPKVIAAAIFLIVGSLLGTLVGTFVSTSLERATGRPGGLGGRLVKGVITVLAVVLAIAQLGVQTKVLETLILAASFGVAGAFALLAALGGKDVAAHLAAGRYVKRAITVGDRVVTGEGIHGTVAEVGAAALVVVKDDGGVCHIAHGRLMADPFTVYLEEPS